MWASTKDRRALIPQHYHNFEVHAVSFLDIVGVPYRIERSEGRDWRIKMTCDLDLSRCGLTKLPVDFDRIDMRGFDVYLDDNLLVAIDRLPINIGVLSANRNKLTSVLSPGDGISAVFLRENCLSDLPDLPDSLEYLDLRNNRIENLPVVSVKCRIELKGNPCESELSKDER